MDQFIQQLFNGLAQGSIYALIALGYTMIYGVLRFINFAHGDVFMVGSFAGYYFSRMLGKFFPPQSIIAALLVFILSMAVCAVLGVTIERLAYKPLRKRARLTVLITAIGVSLFLENMGQFVFGAEPKRFPELIPNFTIIETHSLVLRFKEVVVVGFSLLLMGGLRLFVLNTRTGKAMRAVSYNQQAASLMGINVNNVISITFALGSALAAAAGILYSLNYPSIEPLMGILPGLKAFVAAVLGGIGNIPGATLGGFIIGLVETFTSGYLQSSYRDAIVFSILILILLFKPSGILGSREAEKV